MSQHIKIQLTTITAALITAITAQKYHYMTSTVFLNSETKVLHYSIWRSVIKQHNINTCVHAEGRMQLSLSEKNKYLSKTT